MKNKGLMMLGTLGSIILGIVAPFIAWLCKDKLDNEEKTIINTMLNFEISLVIIGVVLNFIPVLGRLLSLVLVAANIVYAIMAYMAAKDNKALKPIAIYEFLK